MKVSRQSVPWARLCRCCVGLLLPFDIFFRSFRARSVNQSTFVLGKPLTQFYQNLVHILSLVTDNCPCWIRGREKMVVESFSWPNSTKACWRTCGTNPRPSHTRRTRIQPRYRARRLESTTPNICFLPNVLKLCKYFLNGLYVFMWFGYSPWIYSCHFFHFIDVIIYGLKF